MDIAQAMGYQDPSTLSRWANGGTMPTAENLASLGEATGLSVDWLVSGRGPMFASSVSDPLRLQAISRIVNGGVADDVLRALARPRASDTRETLLARMQEIVATLIDNEDGATVTSDVIAYKTQGA
jgi:transcriptional regulator with XRE-family HTH domain